MFRLKCSLHYTVREFINDCLSRANEAGHIRFVYEDQTRRIVPGFFRYSYGEIEHAFLLNDDILFNEVISADVIQDSDKLYYTAIIH